MELLSPRGPQASMRVAARVDVIEVMNKAPTSRSTVALISQVAGPAVIGHFLRMSVVHTHTLRGDKALAVLDLRLLAVLHLLPCFHSLQDDIVRSQAPLVCIRNSITLPISTYPVTRTCCKNNSARIVLGHLWGILHPFKLKSPGLRLKFVIFQTWFFMLGHLAAQIFLCWERWFT